MRILSFVLLSMLCIVYYNGTVAQTTSPIFECRGVWVATVVNIDWPSKKGLSVNEQKAAFIQLLQKHKSNGMNTLFVQIRPAGDALYPSPYEPWSGYLSGKQGIAPNPYYDPLAFMIEETHKMGMEFHAWINPYRAVFNVKTSSIEASHITHKHPNWFITYGTTKYFNPGLPEVRTFLTKIVADIVKRYDIDGIHMDDYFYPYRIEKKEFDDQLSYTLYGKGMDKSAWRRSNCDSIVENVYTTIKHIKPYVKVGISPFGVWRNVSKDSRGSNSKAGQTCYDDLYADILLWLKKGWVDYIVPQLYWNRKHKLCDYDTLLDWWNKHTYGKHLYIGHAIYRAGTEPAWKNKEELPNQIKLLRQYTTTQGSVFFSSKDFNTNPNGWCDSLNNNYYNHPAIVPPMPWIDGTPPSKPIIVSSKNNTFEVTYKGSKPIKGFALFTAPMHTQPYTHKTLIEVITSYKTNATIYADNLPLHNNEGLFIVAIDRNNNISEYVRLQ